jgi:hypothetical protein
MKIRVVFVRLLLILFGGLGLRGSELSPGIAVSWLLGSCVANRREQRRGQDKPGQKPLDLARTELIAQRYNLEPRLLGALLDLLATAANTFLRVLPDLGESRLPLCIPLLQLLIASLKYLSLRGAQLLFVGRGLGLSRGDSAACLIERA